MRRHLAILAIAVLTVPACSEIGDRVDRATNELAAEALEAAVSERLADAGIELDGDPECTTDLDRDGATLTGTADCTGTSTDGRSAKASFDGTLSADGCIGSLTVDVDGERVVDAAEIPGCSVEL